MGVIKRFILLGYGRAGKRQTGAVGSENEFHAIGDDQSLQQARDAFLL